MDFPGKILLFGEYGILLNSMALSLPYHRYSGRFSFAGTSDNLQQQKVTGSVDELSRLYRYLESLKNRFNFLDLERFELDLKKGLYFDSSIPVGSGLGSSGALTAALYSRYLINPDGNLPAEARKHLSSIETCFHGQSSGIDPITSFLKKPVLLENLTATCKTADLSRFLETYTLYLVNTRFMAKTSELVGKFMADYQHPIYRKTIDKQYIPLIAQTIGALLSGDNHLFELSMKSYSLFQLTHFGKMIPEEMKIHFKHGIDRDDFYLKLCGSGGGGYMLAITRDRSNTESFFNLNRLDYFVVEPEEISTNRLETINKHLNF